MLKRIIGTIISFVFTFSFTHSYAMSCQEMAGNWTGQGSNPYSRVTWNIPSAIITVQAEHFTIEATIDTTAWNNPRPRIFHETWSGYCKNERLYITYYGNEVQGQFRDDEIWIYPEDEIIILRK